MAECRDIIMSEEVADFIGRYSVTDEDVIKQYEGFCTQIVNDRYMIIYGEKNRLPEINLKNYAYSTIPKLFGLMDTTSVAATGALRLQNQRGLELTGQDVIVGFIDTGIDYTNDLFRYVTGQSRIVGIWDQTDNTGKPPEGFLYGSEYTREQINSALESDSPYDIVPHRDENGHGTFMASVCCGGYNEQQDFIGAAPNSFIAMVKVKQAKQYLKDFFLIQGSEPVYQENDIMLAMAYLRKLQLKFNKPIVYVLGMGSGNGSRSGNSPLAQTLDSAGNIIGSCVVTCIGNEASGQLHYSGVVTEIHSDNVEINVGENSEGFVLELWGNVPDLFSISFLSPLGESSAIIPAKKSTSEVVNFLIENTTIEVDYSIVESGSGQQLIFMRFLNPSAGVWNIRVYGSNILFGNYNIWANLKRFMPPDVFFLKPNPNMTLTVPSGSENILTIGGYNAFNNAIYPQSGRGYTTDNNVKPDLVAPAVNVFGSGRINQEFVTKTGTSVAASLVAGCCAQLLEWGIVKQTEPYMKTNSIRNYLIRGADRSRDIEYPNGQWGYGKIDVYNSFLILISS